MNKFIADKNSSVPLHHQLYLYIKNLIETGEYKEGESLPSENEMIKLYEEGAKLAAKCREMLEGYKARLDVIEKQNAESEDE